MSLAPIQRAPPDPEGLSEPYLVQGDFHLSPGDIEGYLVELGSTHAGVLHSGVNTYVSGEQQSNIDLAVAHSVIRSMADKVRAAPSFKDL